MHFSDVHMCDVYMCYIWIGCTTVAKELTGMLPDITAMGVKVYGCSPDSLASHDNFIETEELGFPLISDESGAVLDAFSAWKAVSVSLKMYRTCC